MGKHRHENSRGPYAFIRRYGARRKRFDIGFDVVPSAHEVLLADPNGNPPNRLIQLKTRKSHRKKYVISYHLVCRRLSPSIAQRLRNSYPKEKAKWYMQANLLAVQEIYIGHRDDEYRVVRTQLIETSSLAIPLDERIHHTYEFLTRLRRMITMSSNHDEDAIYKVTLLKDGTFSVERLDPAAAEKVKSRLGNPGNPIDRIGIVPRRVVEVLRSHDASGGIQSMAQQ